MSDFERTRIWRSTLAQIEPDPHAQPRERLRAAFLKFRERAGYLANEIAKDIPDLTVHDISHIDALWEMADLLLGDQQNLNPCEAFVLGGAFLLHDLGMSLAAYQNGLRDLTSHPLYKDELYALEKARVRGSQKQARAHVLRTLHAQTADKLATASWRNPADGGDLYLLDDSDLRATFGRAIGTIAYSHWWDILKVQQELNRTLGAPVGFPGEWTVDLLRLACLLRCADASQLDARRAPLFLQALRQPEGIAQAHWNFQRKLHKPTVEHDRLVYTSGQSFSIEEFESWWLGFDMLRMADGELRQVDAMLADLKKTRFAIRGIAGIEEPARLRKLIPTENWEPVDSRIKVADVAGLVAKLGGEELYGKDATVPLRELMQNACDAVRARRILEDKPDDWGEIRIRLWQEGPDHWIEVADTGIGMSNEVLTGPLLDFGNSFWNSALARRELPGLTSQRFEATGKYGIGFFSLFMWGDQVKVITRRFDEGPRESRVLEFMKGLQQRPILRIADESEVRKEPGTAVQVRLREWPLGVRDNGNRTLAELCVFLCPASPVSIYVKDLRKEWRKVISANDWLILSPKRLLARVCGLQQRKTYDYKRRLELIDKWASNMRSLLDVNGNVLGRLCVTGRRSVRVDPYAYGVVTLGGIRSCGLSLVAGVLVGSPVRAARDAARPQVDGKALEVWASEQAKLVRTISTEPKELCEMASILRTFGGQLFNLPVARSRHGWHSKAELTRLAYTSDEFVLVATWYLPESVDYAAFLNEGVLVTAPHHGRILQDDPNWPKSGYGEKDRSYFGSRLVGAVIEAVADGWSQPVHKLSIDHKYARWVVGTKDGRPVKLSISAIIRRRSPGPQGKKPRQKPSK